jgi:hypothetical protein
MFTPMKGDIPMCRQIKLFTILTSVAAILLLVACGGSNNAILGEWRAANPGIVFEFFQDGTVTLDQSGRTFTGEYKFIDSTNIRLDMQGDLGSQAFVLKDVSISGDELTLTLDGREFTLSRANSNPQSSGSQIISGTPSAQKSSSPVDFTGQWINQDKNTRGITRAEIRSIGNVIVVRMWGKCQPKDCDWGETDTTITDADDGTLSITWDFGFKTETQQLNISSGKLQVDGSVSYTDNSGRTDRAYRAVFVRE